MTKNKEILQITRWKESQPRESILMLSRAHYQGYFNSSQLQVAELQLFHFSLHQQNLKQNEGLDSRDHILRADNCQRKAKMILWGGGHRLPLQLKHLETTKRLKKKRSCRYWLFRISLKCLLYNSVE